jgi:hypothetical protein
MDGVVVLRDIEAHADGMSFRSELAALAPRLVLLDFGRSSIGRAVLALPALDLRPTRIGRQMAALLRGASTLDG